MHIVALCRSGANKLTSNANEQLDDWECLSPDALPLIVPHLQPPTDEHPQPDSKAVTQQHIKDQGVPPTLSKVGQQMCKCHLVDKQGISCTPKEHIDSERRY